MSEKIYSDWLNYDKLIFDIVNDTLEDNIIIVQPQEFVIFDKKDINFINNELIKNNKNLIIYIGSDSYNNLNLYSNIKIIYWDSIYFFAKSQIFNIDSSTNNINFYLDKKENIPTVLFTSMCNLKNGRIWRFYVVNEIFKNNLYEFGNFIFRLDKEILFEF